MTRYRPDPNHGRFLPVQDRVGRLIQSLAKSSLQKVQQRPEEFTSQTGPEIPAEAVARMARAWRERSCYLPGELLADPAWGMLLELFHGELAGRRIPLSRLYKLSGVSITSAVRWLKALESRQLVVRRVDPNGSESEFVELTCKASLALRRYFRDMAQEQ